VVGGALQLCGRASQRERLWHARCTYKADAIPGDEFSLAPLGQAVIERRLQPQLQPQETAAHRVPVPMRGFLQLSTDIEDPSASAAGERDGTVEFYSEAAADANGLFVVAQQPVGRAAPLLDRLIRGHDPGADAPRNRLSPGCSDLPLILGYKGPTDCLDRTMITGCTAESQNVLRLSGSGTHETHRLEGAAGPAHPAAVREGPTKPAGAGQPSGRPAQPHNLFTVHTADEHVGKHE
jgi:hypothetical protein